MDNIKSEIRAFLSRATNGIEIEADTNIFELGFTHSLFIMQMILFIESNFGIELELDDIDHDDISTINKIAQLISKNINREQQEVSHAAF
ncbi:natural product biosynthesis carrier protein [Vibrio parahaemolyticus]|uniref:acyl carrier protein n=1 Tax=Vibrio TaxID=662 RepID=UPI000C7A480E|nr:phosphopantetheine-binding protein [Vibrio harveyi]AWA98064.1 acyl carrier protein [Vibrio harveyi]EGQ8542259.1 natural product biosynthesis carrier protein [Vibrio parahaemolyticus]ELC3209718.1 acyl carrier protein [Vibrio parahaemolyticus]